MKINCIIWISVKNLQTDVIFHLKGKIYILPICSARKIYFPDSFIANFLSPSLFLFYSPLFTSRFSWDYFRLAAMKLYPKETQSIDQFIQSFFSQLLKIPRKYCNFLPSWVTQFGFTNFIFELIFFTPPYREKFIFPLQWISRNWRERCS